LQKGKREGKGEGKRGGKGEGERGKERGGKREEERDLLVTRLWPGNADPEALPPICLIANEAEPLDIGSQA
jgi:hypothetical protein